ncbi:MAG: FG-GAP-like repeat-containing protein [Bryobacteraceae bacterium]
MSLIFGSLAVGAPRTFLPDYTFSGSSLTGWPTLGEADWKAQNGEIVGTPRNAAGGWLLLDRSWQDLGFLANFRCTAGCTTGVLFRAEKTSDGGLKGILISLNAGDLAAYGVTLDAQGKILKRNALGKAPSKRGDPVTWLYTPAGNPPGTAKAEHPFPPAPNVNLMPDIPSTRPAGTLHPGDWNELEIIVDAGATKLILNEGPVTAAAGAADAEFGRFGPVALYVGGTGEVRFRDIGVKDLNTKTIPKEVVSNRFRMQRLSDLFYAWSTAVADVNRDGILDLVSGPVYYLGPDYTQTREIYVAESYDPSSQYPRGCAVNFAYDFTGDGWPDEWCATGNNGDGPGVLFVNPRGEPRRWDRYEVTPDVWIEETQMADVDGDGKPELVMGIPGGTIVLARPDPAAPTQPWKLTPISEPGPWAANSSHGIGVGDINGDGRLDVVCAFGWWEQPPAGTKGLWKHHPVAFGRWGKSQGNAGGAEMGIYDVNGDGLNDVVTSLEAHGWGLAWFEQKRSPAGEISLVRHIFMDNFDTKNAGDVLFTEPHGATFADIDGDGIKDFIVGKRFMSHFGYNDPDPYGPAVIYWYRVVRNKQAPGGAEFIPELIHNRSGVGSHLTAMDIDKDGAVDIATSSSLGTYIFWGTKVVDSTRTTSSR